MFAEIKGAIFDMDGTLVDSMWVWDSINKEYLTKRNLAVPKDLRDDIESLSFRESAKYFKKKFNISDSIEVIMNEWNEMAKAAYTNNVKLKPGALEYLKMLKANNIKIGLATSNHPLIVDLTLKQNNIEQYFDAISTTEEVEHEKDFPDIYLLTAKKLKVSPKDCVVFEDILPAIKGAKLAGMKVVAVHDEYSKDKKDDIIYFSDHYIEKYEELTTAV